MQSKLIRKSGNLTINITAHHATFKKWWGSVCSSCVTGSASKYCDVSHHGDIHVITGDRDVVEYIYLTSCLK